ncbi:MAG: alpha-L-fucosidase [Fibrobacterales bacterium]
MVKLYNTTFIGLCVLMNVSILYAAVIPQSGPNPIVFDQTIQKDNLIALMAAGSEHNSELTVPEYGYPKHTFVSNFGAATGADYLKWNISLDEAAEYRVYAVLNSGGVVPLSLTSTLESLECNTKDIGWDRLECGTIQLPTGESSLQLSKVSGDGWIEIKSIELIRESDRPAYETRIQAFKADAQWFAESKYGIMFQYGAWGYPQSGDRKSLNQGAADFDVPAFVQMVQSTGARYVIWSLTWWQYWMQAPVQSVDSIMGHSDFTAERDLVGDIMDALQAEGIRFMLYYHQGIQQEPTWAQHQGVPDEFTPRGTGDRTQFFDNWMTVISELGERYGEKLDGWWFDDGLIYYPAPFEQLGEAARAGNPNRIVAYNSWILTRVTDFQDAFFGEEYHGEDIAGNPTNARGIFESGFQKGLHHHSMFMMEEDWGIHDPNQPMNTQSKMQSANDWVSSALLRNVPLSFNILMWEDGTVSDASLSILKGLKAMFSDPVDGLYNNTSEDIALSGTWSHATARGAGDHGDDVHYTATNGDYAEISFVGTGIEILMPTADNQGLVEVSIDGELVSTVSTVAVAYAPQQTVFTDTLLAYGPHVITIVKLDGEYMQLDGYIVHGEDEPMSSSEQVQDVSSVAVVSSVSEVSSPSSDAVSQMDETGSSSQCTPVSSQASSTSSQSTVISESITQITGTLMKQGQSKVVYFVNNGEHYMPELADHVTSFEVYTVKGDLVVAGESRGTYHRLENLSVLPKGVLLIKYRYR